MSNYVLQRLKGYQPIPGPVACVVMDGVGIGLRDESDGVHMAHTPTLDRLFCDTLFTQLKAHGTAVGMPSDGDMGNSEVGHNALGLGRIIAQGAKLVQEALTSDRLFEGETWKKLIEIGRGGATLHFIGLLSDGNVHSHIDHLFALLDACAAASVERVRIHALLDGRDVGARTALTYLEPLELKLSGLSADGCDYRIASGGGRMITTMDRYNADWSVVERGWKAHVLGDARGFGSATEAVQAFYEEDPNVSDQYLDSFVVVEGGKAVGAIEDGDGVVCFNFRGDRAIELSQAFEAEEFDRFDRQRKPDAFYCGMMQYDGDAKTPANFLVASPAVSGSMGEYLCGTGLTSYAVSETQKYGHVTYFWNGNKSGYIDETLEEYVEIPSDKVMFDERPWMKAAEITDAAVAAIEGGAYQFIRLNYANGDMVGHTGVRAAIRVAVEALDLGLARLLAALEAAGGAVVILADHGNADLMFTEVKGNREPMVAHTLDPVPCIIKDYSDANRWVLMDAEMDTPVALSNVAATLINLLGYEKPEEYDLSLIALKE